MIGRTFAANASASAFCACRPSAAAFAALLRFPSLAPWARRAARAALVRSGQRLKKRWRRSVEASVPPAQKNPDSLVENQEAKRAAVDAIVSLGGRSTISKP
jgi:hypothetical protein